MDIAEVAKKLSLSPDDPIFEQAQEELAKMREIAKASGVPWEKVRERLQGDDVLRDEMKYRGKYAREHDSPEGYKHFFWCINGMELPKHVFYGMVIPMYWAKGRITEQELDAYYADPDAEKFEYVYKKLIGYTPPKLGVVIRAAREFAKTITMTIGFTAFRIGHEPHRMNFLVQIGDASASDNSGKVAEIIRDHPGWKYCFPDVVPDIEKGWGDGGYYVKDTSKSDEEWSRMTATRKAPSMLGTGYASRAIIGKRVDGCANIDDIHDLTNTTSDRELKNTLDKVRSDYLYAPTDDAWLSFVGTPWIEGDTLDYLANTGEFVVVDIPAYLEYQDGEWMMPQNPWTESGEFLYLWEKERGPEWVRKKWFTSTPPEFARMVQLNIKAALEKHFKYQTFPSMDIRWKQWPMKIGIDPVATIRAVSGKEGGTSHFAAAFAMKSPYNNIVIADGILKKCDAEEAERLIANAAREHPTFRNASIEMDGAGILFAGMLKRLTGMSITPHSTAEIRKVLKGVTGKENRQYDFLFPLLAHGAVVISDGDTPFLNTARRYLDRFPNFTRTAPEWDVADAILVAVFDMPEIWTHVISHLVDDRESPTIWRKKQRAISPWSHLGAGYGT